MRQGVGKKGNGGERQEIGMEKKKEDQERMAGRKGEERLTMVGSFDSNEVLYEYYDE